MTSGAAAVAALLIMQWGQDPQPAAPAPQTPQITVYPVLAQIPIFGAVITVPDVPGLPSDGSGKTDLALNGAYMFGFIAETRHWLLDGNALWAAVGASRPVPLTTVDTDVGFMNLVGGVRVGRGLFAIAGVKRVRADITVTLTPARLASSLDGDAHRTMWDPVAGAEYRGHLNPRTRWDGVFKIGGFGVGTDFETSLETTVDWSITRRLVMRAGYEFLYYKLTVTNADIAGLSRTLVSKQTLHG
ncbi:MAG TPA: hypothetical protein VH138_05235, partial [Vicinamibacterales bacterium]|nr:hypothetical protein [Vicinamibacterales bacterium]